MVLDSSAIIALMIDDPERAELLEKTDAAEMVASVARTLAEAGIVLSARMGDGALAALDA